METETWGGYYRKKMIKFGGALEYHKRRILENSTFIEQLSHGSDGGKKIIELGMGFGSVLVELSNLGFNVMGIDNDFGMAHLANDSIKQIGKNNIKITLSDVRCIGIKDQAFDLSFSHGLMEHFSNEDAQRMIKEALRISNRFIFVVPTELATIPLTRKILDLSKQFHGDERYQSIKDWEKIINGADVVIERKFGYWPIYPGGKNVHFNFDQAQQMYGDNCLYAGYHIISHL